MGRKARAASLVLVAWGGLGALVACKADEERAPPIQSCSPDEPGCVVIPPGGGGGGKGGGSGDGGVLPDGSAATSVSGSVIALTGDDFVTGTAYGDPATITAEGAAGSDISAKYDGQTFSLSGVLVGLGVWFDATPNGQVFLPTLQPVNTTIDQPVDLLIVQGSTFDLIYSVLSLPTQREIGRAHVMLRFVDATNGQPLAGVKVSHQTDVVAYDAAGSWSDLETGTGALGMAVIVNAQAQAFTAKQKVVFDTGKITGALDVAMRGDAATLADVAVAP